MTPAKQPAQSLAGYAMEMAWNAFDCMENLDEADFKSKPR
jgi:hypothetical protein